MEVVDKKKNRLPENLKVLRAAKKMSQRIFCDALKAEGISIGLKAYSAYEEGRNEPKINALMSLADYHGVNIDTLIRAEIELVEGLTQYTLKPVIAQPTKH